MAMLNNQMVPIIFIMRGTRFWAIPTFGRAAGLRIQDSAVRKNPCNPHRKVTWTWYTCCGANIFYGILNVLCLGGRPSGALKSVFFWWEKGVPPIDVAMSKVHFRMGERLPWHFGSCVLRTSAGARGKIGYKNPDGTRPKNPMVYHIMSLIFNFFMTVALPSE